MAHVSILFEQNSYTIEKILSALPLNPRPSTDKQKSCVRYCREYNCSRHGLRHFNISSISALKWSAISPIKPIPSTVLTVLQEMTSYCQYATGLPAKTCLPMQSLYISTNSLNPKLTSASPFGISGSNPIHSGQAGTKKKPWRESSKRTIKKGH